MIIVTGANGQLGSQVVERLLERIPAGEVGVSVRDPEAARELEQRGVRVRRGDFADPNSLQHAFEGAEKVLVVSANVLGETAVQLNRTALEAARDAGATRVLYTSHMGVGAASAFPPMRTHAASETTLQNLGVPFTTLRNGFYASSAVTYLERSVASGDLAVPADGPVAWTSHPDLAEVAVLALTTVELNGQTPPLTGAEAFDMAGLAALASELTGREITRRVVPDTEFHAGLLAAGLPLAVADVSLGMFIASRQGDFGPPNPTLAGLVGHAPVSMREVLADALTSAI